MATSPDMGAGSMRHSASVCIQFKGDLTQARSAANGCHVIRINADGSQVAQIDD